MPSGVQYVLIVLLDETLGSMAYPVAHEARTVVPWLFAVVFRVNVLFVLFNDGHTTPVKQ